MGNQFVPALALFNTELSAAITASATTAYVKSVTSIPTAPFHAIIDAGTAHAEIVKVTAVTTATKALTIDRAEGGTTARAHPIDTLVHACEMDARMIHMDGLTVTITGSTALNAMSLTVTDETTGSSGYARGLYIAATASGTKTGSGEHNSLGIDLTVTGDTPYAYIASLYFAQSGNPTIGLISAISVYMDNIGTGVTYEHILDLQTGNPTASAATREAFIRCRNHGTGTPTSILYLQANNNAKVATNFIEQEGAWGQGPVAAASDTSTATWTYKIRCLIGSTTFYIPCVADA